MGIRSCASSLYWILSLHFFSSASLKSRCSRLSAFFGLYLRTFFCRLRVSMTLRFCRLLYRSSSTLHSGFSCRSDSVSSSGSLSSMSGSSNLNLLSRFAWYSLSSSRSCRRFWRSSEISASRLSCALIVGIR
uniref:Putative serine proteinase inhibitor ku family n=1 Tax=Ixodes ricinus TaxID=34613 RepID=A0A6B0URE3_IXORI